jgi:hypothetical protein
MSNFSSFWRPEKAIPEVSLNPPIQANWPGLWLKTLLIARRETLAYRYTDFFKHFYLFC